MKDDLISRKAAIEEMLKCGEYYSDNDEAKRGVAQCIGVIHELPSAQPEKRTEERTETHACDSISRRAAIDALGEAPKFKIGLLKKYAEGRNDQWFDDVAALVKLPSAQPEIIRCKECLMHGVCRFEQGLGLDGYCSQAERRTDENNNE